MGRRDVGEPEYPRSLEEVHATCDRLVHALRTHLGERLVCVLLCGSWARGEAHPPDSDIDLTVIVDAVDDRAIDALREAWQLAEFGYAIIYGRDEAAVLSRERREQVTTNARVVWGSNPLDPPSREDYARQLAAKAEDIARCARHVLVYPWMTPERRIELLRGTLESDMPYTLRYLVAHRTGAFPRTVEELQHRLLGTPEEKLLGWHDGMTDQEFGRRTEEIARRLNEFARSWYAEVAPVLTEGQA
jgi:predicted nucleotidyltransferase